MVKLNVLVVDDDERDADILSRATKTALLKEGLEVGEPVRIGTEGRAEDLVRDVRELLDSRSFQIAVIDLCLDKDDEEDVSGVDAARAVREACPDCQLIFVTGRMEVAVRRQVDIPGFGGEFVEKTSNYEALALPNAVHRAAGHFVGQVNRHSFLRSVHRKKNDMWCLGTRCGERGLQWSKMPVPPVPDDGVVVKTFSLGICGTDINAFGDQDKVEEHDIVDFHEAVGIVAWRGGTVDDRQIRSHDIVIPIVRRCQTWDPPGAGSTVGFGFRPCGLAPSCTSYRHPDACPEGEYSPDQGRNVGYRSRGTGRAPGFGSEFFVDSAEWLIKACDGDSVCDFSPQFLHRLILVEPLAVVWKMKREIEKRRQVRPFHDKALILGLGPIGYLAAIVLHTMHPGIRCVAVDRMPAIRPWIQNLTQRLVPRVEYYSMEDSEAWCPKLGDTKYDIVIEATGQSTSVLGRAIECLNPGGILVLLSVISPSDSTSARIEKAALSRIVKGNSTIIGSVNEAREDYENALEFLKTFHSGERSVLDDLICRLPANADVIERVAELRELSWKERREGPKVVLDTQAFADYLQERG